MMHLAALNLKNVMLIYGCADCIACSCLPVASGVRRGSTQHPRARTWPVDRDRFTQWHDDPARAVGGCLHNATQREGIGHSCKSHLRRSLFFAEIRFRTLLP